ncbi:MAG TPA: hypothetical protein VJ761_07915, partial [Ktedonobacteraceae bacterium]|nr:hypothetical protein [Ktedonobacteraceae bacterium]
GGGAAKQSGGLRAAANRKNNWDDDYNQDTYSSRETGRTFGSGKPASGTRGQSSQWSPRPLSNTSPKVPPSLPPQKSSSVTPSPEPVKPKGQQFKAGDRVRHDKFGEGIILKSEMQEATEFVEVQFGSKFGKKRLSMDFAKLEKI